MSSQCAAKLCVWTTTSSFVTGIWDGSDVDPPTLKVLPAVTDDSCVVAVWTTWSFPSTKLTSTVTLCASSDVDGLSSTTP